MPEIKKNMLLCLGGGTHQLPLIEAARSQGYHLAVVDRSKQAPGLQRAQLAIQEDASNADSILEYIYKLKIEKKVCGVVARSHGEVVCTQARLAENLGLPGAGRGVPEKFQNKLSFKEGLQKSGVLLPRRFRFRTSQEKKDLLNASQPLLVRPSVGHGKKGLGLLKARKEREEFLQKNGTDDGSLLIEEYIAGTEITVLGMAIEGQFFLLAVLDKITSTKPPLHIELAHVFPSQFVSSTGAAQTASSQIQEQIVESLQKICDFTGLKTAPIVAEFLLKNENAFLVEAAPEVGGEYLAEELLKEAFPKWNYFSCLIQTLTRKPPPNRSQKNEADGLRKNRSFYRESQSQMPGMKNIPCPSLPQVKDTAQHVRLVFVPQHEGTFQEIRWPQGFESIPEVFFKKKLKGQGSQTSFLDGNLGRLAVFGLRCVQGPKAHEKLESLSAQILAATTILYNP